MSATQSFFQARVSVLWGDRRVSDFMAAAGLGITGVGQREVLVIDYKPGEAVDEARVRAGMDKMIQLSDAERTAIKVISYEVLNVREIRKEEHALPV